MSPPVLVATDLDGTLIRSDGTVSARTRAALGRVRRSGATVVFVTGRPSRVMAGIAAQTAASGLAICANGALVFDLDAGVAVSHRYLESATALRLARAIRELVPDAAFAVESGTRFGREPRFETMWPDPQELVGAFHELLVTLPATKLLVRRGGRPFTAVYDVIVELAGADAVVTTSSADLVEIAGPGVSKAVALAELAAQRGVRADQVVAFGDMPNDLPMFAWAGHSVAVANAHPDVLAAADEITASNDDDGVALILERLFPAD
ncbi:HAD family hydrolase [Frankia canadensis]|uniref:HAD family hydrolase n=1 Tax=Frankia canadensis TaxID=1836972 RepID=UPI000C7B7862|nr:Cof-type HAD-IIB family hydrolase [Frankia canadensis]